MAVPIPTSSALPGPNQSAGPHHPRQADNDAHLIELWLARSRSAHTRRAYRRIADRFAAAVGDRPFERVTLGDIQAYAAGLGHLADSSQAQAVAAVKSLFGFAVKIGYLRFNPAAAVVAPKPRDRLAERLMPEEAVLRMIALEPGPRNRALIRTLYASGGRVSELCQLAWRDVQARPDTADEGGGQLTLHGKGGKTRWVMLTAATWEELIDLKGAAGPDDAVFASARGGHLDPATVWRVVRAAARRAGLNAAVSPHWLRHAHASHALDRGAPVHLVQQTLGHASLATTSRYTHARPGDSSARFLPV